MWGPHLILSQEEDFLAIHSRELRRREFANAERHDRNSVARAICAARFRIGPRRIEVLRGISLEVAQGEAVFLCGASGAGKTTLLYTLAGLERPESGTVEFEGRRLYTGSESSQAQLAQSRRWVLFSRDIFCCRN